MVQYLHPGNFEPMAKHADPTQEIVHISHEEWMEYGGW
jgi:hypothetical protein